MSINCFLTDSCEKFKRHPECIKEDFCEKHRRVERLLSLALLNEKQMFNPHLKIDSKGLDKEAFVFLKTHVGDRIVDFVNSGESLYIHSDICGNGKTSWAIRLIQLYIDKIWTTSPLSCRALFISVPTFLIAIKRNISQRDELATYIIDNILKADLVVWDDIATKALTDYEAEILFSYIDQRLNLGKANIYTCNLKKEEMLTRLGDRLYSRVVRPSHNIEFFASDKREREKGSEEKA